MATSFSRGSLLLTAKAIAGQFGIRLEFYNGPTAVTSYTESGKCTIKIPALVPESDDYVTYIRGYLDHECGHVRFTDVRAMQGTTIPRRAFQFFNVLEDVDVERKLSALYPGCKRNLRGIVKLLFGTPLPGVHDAISIDNYILSWVRHCQHPDIVTAEAVRRIEDALLTDVQAGVRKWPANFPHIVKTLAVPQGTTQGNLDRAWELYVQLFGELDPVLNDALQHVLQAQPGDGQSGDGQSGGGQSGGGQSGDGQSGGGQPGDGQPGDGQSGGGTSSSSGYQLSPEQLSRLKERLAEDVYDDTAAQLRAKPTGDDASSFGVDYNYLNVHPGVVQKFRGSSSSMEPVMMTPLPARYAHAAMAASVKLSGQIRSWFQTMTITRRSPSGLSGKLDRRHLYRTAVGNDRVFYRDGRGRDVHAEVCVLVDNSGSMSGDSACYAGAALLALFNTLHAIPQVRLTVLFFDDSPTPVWYRTGMPSPKSWCAIPRGGTDMFAALPLSEAEGLSDPTAKRILIILSDGATENQDLCTAYVDSMRSRGVYCMGIGICDPSLIKVLGDKACKVVTKLPDLIPALLTMFRDAMIGSN